MSENGSKVRICVIGASGRMGQEIIKVILNDKDTEFAGAVERADSSFIGMPALEATGLGKGGPAISKDITTAAKNCDVLIDFTGAEGTYSNLSAYKSTKKPLVIGSTGLNEKQRGEIIGLGSDMPLLMASNMSVGVNLMAKLVELAAKILDEDFDIELFEAHHKHKKDAPSGTALTLGEAAAKGRGIKLSDAAVYDRHGITGERKKGSIGFQIMRGGDIAGDHTVFFCGNGERVEITHRASSREIFARGAVRAAKWLCKKQNGLYSINDVLGL